MAGKGELHGHALLIDGRRGEGPPPRAPRAPLAHLAEILRATSRSWLVRRLGGGLGDDFSVDRRMIQRELELLRHGAPAVAIAVIAGEIAVVDDELALVTGEAFGEEEAEESLSLAWVGAQLAACGAAQLVVIAALTARSGSIGEEQAAGEGSMPQRLLATLAGERATLALVQLEPGRRSAIDAVVDGLRGEAIDARRGAITASSLAAFLRGALPEAALLHRGEDGVLLEAPPLARLWDLGWLVHGSLRTVPAKPGAVEVVAPLLGTTLPGRFRIDAEVAAGGFGAVYRARQLTVDRDVAVKVLRSSADPFSEEGRLFVHEIQAVGKIDHPNVVRVHQADVTADGRLFFAMELLEGRDLQALIDAGRVPLPRALALMQQLLAALEAAHQVGLVHADVKPANAIVVAARGGGERLVLVDFGLARLRPRGEAAESVGGTPAFMAPEQLRDSRIDARSDLFSAALVLVALVTGWRRRSAGELVPPDEVIEELIGGAAGASRASGPPGDSTGDSASGSPGDSIDRAGLRAAIRRALAIDPEERFASAGELAAALTGAALDAVQRVARPPFHGLASFTEDDREHFHGRDRELEQLTELVLYRRVVVVTAPSGVGKTSLLRAGLVPRLRALAVKARYVSCRTDDEVEEVAALVQWEGRPRRLLVQRSEVNDGTREASEAAFDQTQPQGARRRDPAQFPLVATEEQGDGDPVVLLVDQVESALEREGGSGEDGGALLDAVFSLISHRRSQITVVLAVREDFLARLLDRMSGGAQSRSPAGALGRGDRAPILRIGPLDEAGARDAIVRPLAERRLSITSELLERLLADLGAAGARLGAELGWASPSPIYPPHLQLTCAVLHDRLPSGEAVITLEHYRALGGFDAIVGEHLDRVLDGLGPSDAALARDLFLALVTSAQGRTLRSEAELSDALPVARRARLSFVLEALRAEGLMVSTRRAGEPAWELIHDSLVPRVLAWIDARDLMRRRAIELVRYHLRRSSPEAPSLLSRAELREVTAYGAAIAELDAEWRRQERGAGAGVAWSPLSLVARSRQLHRRTAFAAGALVAAIFAVLGVAIYERRLGAAALAAEAHRRDLNLGLVAFELAPFDWDVQSLRAVDVPLSELPELSWTLHAPQFENPDEPEVQPISGERLLRRSSRMSSDGASRTEHLEVPGGPAFLVLHGRGRAGEACADSVIPLRSLPGYAQRSRGEQLLKLAVPTCRASKADMIEIPAGPFFFGGPGDPPSSYWAEVGLPGVVIRDEPAFAIDRTEVTNAAFRVFAAMQEATGIDAYQTAKTRDLRWGRELTSPATSATWREARLYCAFLGKQLPSSAQWEKAMRGGLLLGSQLNPAPLRSFPWGHAGTAHLANLADEVPKGVRPVGSFLSDRSPYGVLDLAGNVQEWIRSAASRVDEQEFFRGNLRMTRGGNWSETPSDDAVNYVPIENARIGDTRGYMLGWRCTSR